jgi:hypothetical protein
MKELAVFVDSSRMFGLFEELFDKIRNENEIASHNRISTQFPQLTMLDL